MNSIGVLSPSRDAMVCRVPYPGLASSGRLSLPDEIGALVLKDHVALGRRAAGSPGNDSIAWSAGCLALVHHLAVGIDGLTDDHRSTVGELVDAKKGAASFAEILHAQSEHRVEEQKRTHHEVRKAAGSRIVGIGVERIVVERQCREEHVVTGCQRAAPMMAILLTYLEILERVATSPGPGACFQVGNYIAHSTFPMYAVTRAATRRRRIPRCFVR